MTPLFALLLWCFLVLRGGNGVSSFTFVPNHKRAESRLLSAINIKLEPLGEYRDINVSRETDIRNKLQDPTIHGTVKKALFEQVKGNPESYAPFLFLDAIAYMVMNRTGTLDEIAKWYARLMFRSRVDIVMSRDETLADIPEIFSMHFTGLLSEWWPDFGERQDEWINSYTDAYFDAFAWDRKTARQYDRRWVSLHSIKNTLNSMRGDERDAKLNYLGDEKLLEVQTDVEKTAKKGSWFDVLTKWATVKEE